MISRNISNKKDNITLTNNSIVLFIGSMIFVGLLVGIAIGLGNFQFSLLAPVIWLVIWLIKSNSRFSWILTFFIFVNIVFGWTVQKAIAPIQFIGWEISFNYIFLFISLIITGYLFIKKELILPSPDIYIPLLVFLILAFFSLIQTYYSSPRDRYAIFTEGGSLVFYLLLFSFTHVLRTTSLLIRFVYTILIANIITAILTIGYLYGYIYLPGVQTEFGTISRSFVVASDVILFGWFLSWSVFLNLRNNKLLRFLAFISIVSGVYIFIASQTRTILIAIPIGIVTLIGLIILNSLNTSKTKGMINAYIKVGLLLIILATIVVLALVIVPRESISFINRTTQITTNENSWFRRSIEPRVLWNYAIEQNPIFGIGIGRSFIDLYNRYDLEALREVHSNFTWLLLKMGILGLLTYIIFIFSAIKGGISTLLKVTNDIEKTWIIGSLSALIAVLSFGLIASSTIAFQYDIVMLVLFIAIIDFIRYKTQSIDIDIPYVTNRK